MLLLRFPNLFSLFYCKAVLILSTFKQDGNRVYPCVIRFILLLGCEKIHVPENMTVKCYDGDLVGSICEYSCINMDIVGPTNVMCGEHTFIYFILAVVVLLFLALFWYAVS